MDGARLRNAIRPHYLAIYCSSSPPDIASYTCITLHIVCYSYIWHLADTSICKDTGEGSGCQHITVWCLRVLGFLSLIISQGDTLSPHRTARTSMAGSASIFFLIEPFPYLAISHLFYREDANVCIILFHPVLLDKESRSTLAPTVHKQPRGSQSNRQMELLLSRAPPSFRRL